MQDLQGKHYRILALAVAFFLAGAAFFVFDKVNLKSNSIFDFNNFSRPFSSKETQNNSPIGYYPSPVNFKKFFYNPAEIQNESILHVEGECNDVYAAILFFESDFDYRNDPSRARLNKAISCPLSKRLNYDVRFSDLGGLKLGEYYIIVADQGESGLWYNPR